MGDLAQLSDEALTVRLQRAAFSLFCRLRQCRYRPRRGHLAPRLAMQHRRGWICALLLSDRASRNGWMSRADAAARTLKVLRFFLREHAERCARCDRL